MTWFAHSYIKHTSFTQGRKWLRYFYVSMLWSIK